MRELNPRPFVPETNHLATGIKLQIISTLQSQIITSLRFGFLIFDHWDLCGTCDVGFGKVLFSKVLQIEGISDQLDFFSGGFQHNCDDVESCLDVFESFLFQEVQSHL